MAYSVLATSKTPALIIYLLDVSASMNQPLGDKRRIDVVTEALTTAWKTMVFRSTKGSRISPRYRVSLLAYSDHVYDLLGGPKDIDKVVQLGVPELSPMRTSSAATGFTQVEKILQSELNNLQACPAPLVCHMTDGEFTGTDPEPIVRRIMAMQVPDGNVLVENIFISDKVLSQPITDPYSWGGVLPNTRLVNEHMAKLRSISSPVPESYRLMMLENNYHLEPGALMILPGSSPELVSMGFQMSAATPVR